MTPDMTAPLSLDEWRKKYLTEILRDFAGLAIMPQVVAEDIRLAADEIERLTAENAALREAPCTTLTLAPCVSDGE